MTKSVGLHPSHPALVHFPIACWVLATGVDIAGYFLSMPQVPGTEWGSLSGLLLWAGNILALPAMVAGMVDYARLPRAVQDSAEIFSHIALMCAGWTLFLGAAIWRMQTLPFGSTPTLAIVLVETAASACLVAGGHHAASVVFALLPRAKGRDMRNTR